MKIGAKFRTFRETGKYKFIGFMCKTIENAPRLSRKFLPKPYLCGQKGEKSGSAFRRKRQHFPEKALHDFPPRAAASRKQMQQPTRPQEALPFLDLPVPFIAGCGITDEVLDLYRSSPCRIEACIFALCEKGSLRVHINLREYCIRQDDIVVLAPGSFIQVHESSADCSMGFIGFSGKFTLESGFRKTLSPYMPLLLDKPILPLPPRSASVYRDSISLLARAQELHDLCRKPRMLGHIMGLFAESIGAAYDRMPQERSAYSTRDREILGEFLQLAFENYREEHKVLFYAQAAGLTLSHFCSVISRTAGQTAQEILKGLLIMDAKAQLRNTKATVSQIASTLGFHTPTTFNRYFRTYTGMTPQDYRNRPR